MTISRRAFLKGTAGVAGAGAVTSVLSGKATTLVAGAEKTAAVGEEWVPTTCWIGKQDCGMLARRIDGRVVKLEGNPAHPRNLGTLCPKGVSQITDLYDPSRLRAPLIRTNPKGEPGTWRQASWEEALDIIAERLGRALERDPRLVAFVPGRMKVGGVYDTAFRQATGIPHAYGRRGNDCAGPAQDALLATWGDRGVIAPDLRHCKYLICYWNLTQAGGPALCWITHVREVADAKARGMKVVAIDPYGRSVSHFADEWVPIKPGTDLAFWLAILRVLLEEGHVDTAFLKARTNAPSLVRDDGSLLREGGEELVWDVASGRPARYGPGVEPALDGEFTVGGERVRTAFKVLRDQVEQYPPEWAAEVAGVPAEQIRRIGQELGRNAMIGSTVVIDGVEVPYRPVAFGLHGTAVKFHSALQTNRAILLAFMILGAVEAAGGPHFWNKRVADPALAQQKWLEATAKETPDRLDLGGTKWFPMGSSGYHMFPLTVASPEAYDLPYRPEEMAVLVHFVNPVMTSRPIDRVLEAWQRFGFVAVITPYLTATADYVADVVLATGTLDKWEGPLAAKTLYDTAEAVRAPLMPPLGQSRGEMEIYTDLCDHMGKLYDAGGFIDQVNQTLDLKEEYRLALDARPTPEAILDAWARSKHGIGLEPLQRTGVISRKLPADRLYLSAGPAPFDGVRGHFYVEAFLEIGRRMRERGVQESLWSRYLPFPAWSRPRMEDAPPRYDLYLMDFKRIEHKHSRTSANPLLRELAPHNPLLMNAGTARRRALKDGDGVWVESHNPVTGETRRVRTQLVISELIRPDTVALTHHVSRPDQPSVNALLFYGDGFWDIGGGWFSHIKVRVWKG